MVRTVQHFVIKNTWIYGQHSRNTVSENHFGIEWKSEVSCMCYCLKIIRPKSLDETGIEMNATSRVLRSGECVREMQYDLKMLNSMYAYAIPSHFPQQLGFVDGDPVVIEYDVQITGSFPPIRNPKTLNFEFPNENLTNLELLVEGKTFHINKATLAFHSSYFNTLFFGPFRECDQSTIELKEIKADAFQDLLQILYLAPDIYDDNVQDILKVARMYEIKPATVQCEQFLMFGSKMVIEEKWELAEEFALDELKNMLSE